MVGKVNDYSTCRELSWLNHFCYSRTINIIYNKIQQMLDGSLA